jgi:uncharacterized protein YmfQ (DUF2313 family)
MPEWDEIYKRIVPGLWPKRMVKRGSDLEKDLETRGHVLSQFRELLDWILHAFFPSLDANGLFLDRWEASLGIEPEGTTAARVARIEASLRQRHTMTEAQLKAVFCRCWTANDPDLVMIAYPTAANIDTYSTNELTNLHDQNYMHIWDSDNEEPNFALADDLIRRLCPAWQRWTIGRAQSMTYGDGGTSPSSAHRWGRAAIGNG